MNCNLIQSHVPPTNDQIELAIPDYSYPCENKSIVIVSIALFAIAIVGIALLAISGAAMGAPIALHVLIFLI